MSAKKRLRKNKLSQFLESTVRVLSEVGCQVLSEAWRLFLIVILQLQSFILYDVLSIHDILLHLALYESNVVFILVEVDGYFA